MFYTKTRPNIPNNNCNAQKQQKTQKNVKIKKKRGKNPF